LVRREQQHREQRARLQAAELHGLAIALDVHRAQKSEVHLCLLKHRFDPLSRFLRRARRTLASGMKAGKKGEQMNHCRLASIVVLTLAISVSSAAAGRSMAAGGAKLTSSLDGKSVLPHAIRWLAKPPTPYSRITKVQFLIDGKLRWIETKAPYVYGDDSDELVTTWLTAGKHTFTVRAFRRGATTLTRTTKARVLPAPSPPPELSGTTWNRTLSRKGSGGSPAGTWTLHVTSAGWKIDDPMGGTNFIDAIYRSPDLVGLADGIWTRPRSIHEGNGWCEDTNSPVHYRWSMAGDTLSLKLSGTSRCGDQADVLGGDWKPA
jgi:hypothetical protein